MTCKSCVFLAYLGPNWRPQSQTEPFFWGELVFYVTNHVLITDGLANRLISLSVFITLAGDWYARGPTKTNQRHHFTWKVPKYCTQLVLRPSAASWITEPSVISGLVRPNVRSFLYRLIITCFMLQLGLIKNASKLGPWVLNNISN